MAGRDDEDRGKLASQLHRIAVVLQPPPQAEPVDDRAGCAVEKCEPGSDGLVIDEHLVLRGELGSRPPGAGGAKEGRAQIGKTDVLAVNTETSPHGAVVDLE